MAQSQRITHHELQYLALRPDLENYKATAQRIRASRLLKQCVHILDNCIQLKTLTLPKILTKILVQESWSDESHSNLYYNATTEPLPHFTSNDMQESARTKGCSLMRADPDPLGR